MRSSRRCRKSLPTQEHWGLARGEATGLIRTTQLGGDCLFAPLSNFFKNQGPVPVGSMAGMTTYGAFDMAGNVREWCCNETPERRIIKGGTWTDNTYMFGQPSQAPPWGPSPTNGFRCAFYPDPAKVPAAAFASVTFDVPRDYSKQKPVSDEIFQYFKAQFDYDETDLNPQVDGRRETPEWTLERITFDAAYGGERIIAWLFLPKSARPPFQTVIYFPGTAPVRRESSEQIEDYYEFRGFLSFIVKNGRAVLFPVYKGTFERSSDELAAIILAGLEAGSSRRYLEALVQEVKDFKRSVDYLETRPDIDATKLAYYGMSWGGELGAVIPAVEERLKNRVMLSGGFAGEPLPEADPVNYPPRVMIPTLMLNGKYDSGLPLDTSQQPMFDLLGSKEKQHLLDETDHLPTSTFYIRETLKWLDTYLGPVKQASISK